jgi:helix-turn-helix protein
LQVAHAASAPPDGSDVGEVIRWYRIRENLTQQEAADKLRTTQSRLSKLEQGSQALRPGLKTQGVSLRNLPVLVVDRGQSWRRRRSSGGSKTGSGS